MGRGIFKTEAGSGQPAALVSSELSYRRARVAVSGSRVAAFLLYATVLAFLVTPSAGHAQASAYVPLDDISYTYIEALLARGQFKELSMLERPFTERALRVAIDSARAREPGRVVSSYLDALYTAVEKYAVRPGDSDSAAAQTFRARGTGDLYLTGQTSGRRELMLADSSGAVRPGGALRLVMAGGPVVGFSRVLIDSRLNTDPEFAGRKDRTITGRTEDGYLSGQWRYAELSFGRVGRNWGPPSEHGLLLGNYAYTYDHVYAQIGTDRIHWSTVIAKLDNIVPPSGPPEIQRYFSIHRLALHVSNWEIAATESYVYGGAGRAFEPALMNPFNIYGLSWRQEQQEGNLGLGGEVALRTDRFGTFAGQFFIDDLQVDHSCNPACKQPSSYGLTATADGLPLGGDQRWFASYTRVSNLAYNNKNPDEHYEIFGVGLQKKPASPL